MDSLRSTRGSGFGRFFASFAGRAVALVAAVHSGLQWLLHAGQLSTWTYGIAAVVLTSIGVALLARPLERARLELRRCLGQLDIAAANATRRPGRASSGKGRAGSAYPQLAERVSALNEARQAAERATQTCRRTARHLIRAQRIGGLGSWEWKRGGQGIDCSAELFRILGINADQRNATPGRLLGIVHNDDRRALRRWAIGLARGGTPPGIDVRAHAGNGKLLHLRVRGEPLYGEGNAVRAVVGTVQEATEYAQAIHDIHRLAYYDVLTELPNRTRFREVLAETLALARRSGQPFAILFIDLDQFKRVNDTLGHAIGDELLRIVARRLSRILRSQDIAGPSPARSPERQLCRQGGDEFIVLLDGVADEGQATRAARRLLDSLAQPITLGPQEVFMSASIGIVLCPRDGDDLDVLLNNADIAMYHAKSEGRNRFSVYQTAMREATADRLVLEHGLRRAIEAEEFELHYQPQVDVRSGAITGVEALVRWNHPTRGLLGPKCFITVAEDAGLIMAIWEWVFVTALIQQVAWREQGFPPITMSVNLSSVQFADVNLARRIEDVARAVGAPLEHIELEITESVLMRDFEAALATLRELREMGVKIAIDDFGTGYSSLSYLRRLPLDTLKLDLAFTGDAMQSKEAAAITRAIIAMAESLELKVVAEGVETQAQLDFLAANGCTTMQGYLLSRPMPAPAITELLQRGHPAAGARAAAMEALA